MAPIDGPDPQTHLAETANQISVAAVSFAMAAFVVTFLQLLLGNLISNTARWKTSYAAIDLAARYRTWKITFWKVKIYYPMLNFDISAMLEAAKESEESGIHRVLGKKGEEPGREWRPVQANEGVTSKHISDGKFILYSQAEPATVSILTWGEWFQYKWWQSQHPILQQSRPRATWAQLIRALGITDVNILRRRNPEVPEQPGRQLDADTIPAGIDVPIQRIRLADLGKLALSLGFTRVKIDIEKRDFSAVGPHGTMKMEEIQTFGKVVRFEGDIYAIHADISRCKTEWIKSALGLSMGRMKYERYTTSGVDLHLDPLLKAISEKFNEDRYREESMSPLRACLFSHNLLVQGCPMNEANHAHSLKFEDLPDQRAAESYQQKNELKSELAKWQATVGLTVPTVLVAATFAGISAVTCGFPSRILLHKMRSWCLVELEDLMRDRSECIIESKRLQELAMSDEISFFQRTSRFVMGRDISDDGLSSWVSGRWRGIYSNLPQDLQNEIVQKNRDCCHGRAVIMPMTRKLLENYEPIQWAKDSREIYLSGKLKKSFPENMLWLQVVLLDLAIRVHIKGREDEIDDGWDDNLGYKKEGKIVEAIIGSWKLKVGSDAPFQEGRPNSWDLQSELIEKNERNGNDKSLNCSRLALLLKLRALFFIAFLMVGPDSSDVFLADDSEVEMPIV